MTLPARPLRAALASAVLFFTMGFVVASWLSRLPEVRDALGLAPSEIGFILLLGSVGSLVALPSSGPLIGKVGATVSGRIGVTLWSCGMAGVALAVGAGSRTGLVLALVCCSCGMSTWGATMNVEGGYSEAALGRTILASLHGMYSIGTVLGALAGAALIHLHVPVPVHLATIALAAALSVWTATHFFLTRSDIAAFDVSHDGEREVRAKGRTKQAWSERRTVLIGVMVLSAGLMEGAANDWLPLAMVDGYGTGEAMGSVVLALFLCVMTVIRFVSGRLLRRWGASALLRVLLLLACVGLALFAWAPAAWAGILGVVFWAMGSALVFPSGGSALSRDPRMTAARMSVLSTINYGAVLIGPPVLGMVADHIGYHRALALLILPVLFAVTLARNLDEPEEREAAPGTGGSVQV